MPIRVVLDTNILVSGLHSPGGNEGQVLRLVASGTLQAWVSEPILAEHRDVLFRPKFGHLPEASVHSILNCVSSGPRIRPEVPVRVSADPDDDLFLGCAEAAAAEYLVTGNKRHFPAQWKQTRIVNARELLDALHL